MRSLIHTALAAVIVGAMGVVFTVSFAAIIYGGTAAPGLSRGIGLSLAGAAVVAVFGVYRLSYRDTVVQPQDVTAIILSLAVAGIAADWQGAPDALLATVVALVGASTALTGLAAWLGGRFRLGFLLRFIPYPLIGGFLAATGYLIVFGAIGMTLHQSLGIWNLGPLLEPSDLVRWLPWIAAGGAMTVVSRRWRNDFMLPVGVLLFLAAFYLILFASGGDLATARARAFSSAPSPTTSSPISTPRASPASPGARSPARCRPSSRPPAWRSSAACSTPRRWRSPPAATSTPTASCAASARRTSRRRRSAA